MNFEIEILSTIDNKMLILVVICGLKLTEAFKSSTPITI